MRPEIKQDLANCKRDVILSTKGTYGMCLSKGADLLNRLGSEKQPAGVGTASPREEWVGSGPSRWRLRMCLPHSPSLGASHLAHHSTGFGTLRSRQGRRGLYFKAL